MYPPPPPTPWNFFLIINFFADSIKHEQKHEKIQHVCSSYSVKTKGDGQTDGRTFGCGGGGGFNISPPGPSARREFSSYNLEYSRTKIKNLRKKLEFSSFNLEFSRKKLENSSFFFEFSILFLEFSSFNLEFSSFNLNFPENYVEIFGKYLEFSRKNLHI